MTAVLVALATLAAVFLLAGLHGANTQAAPKRHGWKEPPPASPRNPAPRNHELDAAMRAAAISVRVPVQRLPLDNSEDAK